MKHLITGAGGFLGSYLVQSVRALDPQADVVSLGLKAPAHSALRHFECDLADRQKIREFVSVEKPERIYHLAGSARVSQDVGMPEYYRSNFETTRNLLDALESVAGPQRLFFASSVHVYGNQSGEVDEATEPAPNGFYGMSKYLGERLFETYCARRPGTSAVVGRLYTCIGPGQAPGFVTSDLAAQLSTLPESGGVLKTGPLTARRRFLDVRDAADLIARLVQHPSATPFEVVNIASPFEMQVKEIVELLVKVSGKKVRIESRSNAQNTFQGLNLNRHKMEKTLPGFKYRPLEKTVSDLWQHHLKSNRSNHGE